MSFSGKQDRDRSYRCWIVTTLLTVERVRAEYRAKSMRWTYWREHEDGYRTSGDWLAPYFPTLGNGNRSFWGDGEHFKTRREAAAAQRKLARKAEVQIRQESAARLKRDLAELRKRVQDGARRRKVA